MISVRVWHDDEFGVPDIAALAQLRKALDGLHFWLHLEIERAEDEYVVELLHHDDVVGTGCDRSLLVAAQQAVQGLAKFMARRVRNTQEVLDALNAIPREVLGEETK